MGLSILPLAARAAVGLGALAYNAYRTNSTNTTTMAAPIAARRVAGRRVSVRRKRMPVRMYRRPARLQTSYFARTGQRITATLSSGKYTASNDVTLDVVYLTDIQGAYDMYRIRKVTVEVLPAHDPGNGYGATHANVRVYHACDSRGTATTGSLTDARELSQFENHRYSSIVSGTRNIYTFYPKATNVVQSLTGPVSAGNYEVNPWINLDQVTIPHHRHLLWIESTDPASAELFNLVYTVHFECRRSR